MPRLADQPCSVLFFHDLTRRCDLPSESTRNSRGTSLNTGEQAIQDSLTGEQRLIGRQLVGDGTRSSDGPVLHHRVFRLDTLELGLKDDILITGRITASASALTHLYLGCGSRQ